MDSLNKTSIYVKEAVQGGQVGVIVILLALVALVIYAAFFLWSTFMATSLETVTMLKTDKIDMRKIATNISKDITIPAQNNGGEFSVAFWVYMNNEGETSSTSPKFVLGRTTSSARLSKSSPLFYMDPETNKMYVALKNGNPVSLNAIHSSPDIPKLEISYLPLQRWVNVLLVVDNNYLQLFMDGELREVKDVTEMGAISEIVGDFYVGSTANVPSANGYITRVQAFNYALTIEHAKMIYSSGPIRKSALSKLGLPMYGIRSPFVRLDKEDDSKDCNQ